MGQPKAAVTSPDNNYGLKCERSRGPYPGQKPGGGLAAWTTGLETTITADRNGSSFPETSMPHLTRLFAFLSLAQASSTTVLRSVPSSGQDTSTTSPGLSQRGGSVRGPILTGVPVTMMSAGLMVMKVVM